MKDETISQEKYDAIKDASPAQSFSGTIQSCWQPMFCDPTHYHEKKMALRLDNGGMFFFDITLAVSKVCGAKLPEGTRITITVPAGSMGPFNRFNDKPMRFQPHEDDGILWCTEHPDPPEPYDNA